PDASDGALVPGSNTQPLVSVVSNHDPRSSIFDANHTKVSGRLVKAMAWYDNVWGFPRRTPRSVCVTLETRAY
ncbi:hypothetical protein ACLBSJ_33765, partial [Klebsiella pneumoniae]